MATLKASFFMAEEPYQRAMHIQPMILFYKGELNAHLASMNCEGDFP